MRITGHINKKSDMPVVSALEVLTGNEMMALVLPDLVKANPILILK
jgi:hypothetical protein